MDHLQTRLEALEQQMHAVNRRLRWWRGLAVGLVGLALLSLLLSSTPVQGGEGGGLPALQRRVAALESLLEHFSRQDNEVVITGANLRIVNGLEDTQTTNGLGNLIVGYNELRSPEEQSLFGPDNRTGSHNVVVGRAHNFSSFGGVVAGLRNEISGGYASASGGADNKASGSFASVGGGEGNTASGVGSWVSGGLRNTASGDYSSSSGGLDNTASGNSASVSGGFENTATGVASWVSGGQDNTASGLRSSVSGGEGNTASGVGSSVSGGRNRTAVGNYDWVAGSLFQDE